MHKHFAAASLIAFALTTPAFALNPQPEPPGKSRVVHTPSATTTMHSTIGTQSSGGGAGATADSDDNYCGTPVPGHHVHVNATTGTAPQAHGGTAASCPSKPQGTTAAH
jgi:hypothetical protein